MQHHKPLFFAGIDWGSQSYQVCVVDQHGSILGEKAFDHSGKGLNEMALWILESCGCNTDNICVSIEVNHGPVVQSLLEKGFDVYSINPKQLDEATVRSRVRHMETIVERMKVVDRQLKETENLIDGTINIIASRESKTADRPGDIEILRSVPGIGMFVLGTFLSEAYELLCRRDYASLRSLAGAAPVTRQSGKTKYVVRRRAASKRLMQAVYHMAGIAVVHDP